MKNYDIKDLADKLCELAKINFESSWQGDSVTANKAYAKSTKYKKYVVDNPQIAEELTSYMIASSDLHMVHQGMVISLSVGVNTEQAKNELKKEIAFSIAEDKLMQKVAFETRMIKENIDRLGYLVMYKGQKNYATYDKAWHVLNK